MEAGAAPGVAPSRPSIWLALGRILSLAGVLVLIVAFVAALPFLVETATNLLLDLPSRLLTRRAIVGASLVVIVGAAIVLVARIGRGSPSRGLVIALVTFVALRVLVDVVLDGPIVSDWLFYEQLARASLLGAPPISDTPMGYPYLLAAAMTISGTGSLVAAEALNLALATVMAILLAIWVEALADRRAAAIAVLILALCPSQVLYGVIVGTEVAYAAAVMALVLVATLLVRRLRATGSDRIVIGLAATAGLVLGLSAYVRATSLAIAPLVILLPMLATGRPRASAPAVLTMLVAASIALVPAIAANRGLLDRWSPSTSLYLGWQLYVGSNVASEGQYDERDVDTLDAAVPGSGLGEVAERWSQGDFDPAILTAAARRDEVAVELALDRILDAGPALIALLPVKVMNAWGPADDAVSWTLARGPNADRAARPVVDVAAQAWWVLALGFALAGLWRRSRGTRDAMLVSAVVIVPLALGLLVLEAKGRYHEPVVPLVAGLAALGVAGYGAGIGPRSGIPEP